MRVWVYVDGFNLYNGVLKRTPYKWLDLHEMSRRLLAPSDSIDRIKYFTAQVQAWAGIPANPIAN